MRREGVKNFHIWPDFPRDEYNTIIYLQPQAERNQLAIGYDMSTEAVRRAAMEHARDTGMPTASGRVVLVQDVDDDRKPAGFLMYAPVYRNGTPISSDAERREAFQGFVYSPFRIDDFLAAAIADKSYDVSFRVYDGSEVKPENLIHDSWANSTSSDSVPPHFIAATTQNVAGRTWTLNYATKPSFELTSSRAFLPYTFAAGVLLSLLFFVVTRSQVHARNAAERAAAEVKESEATIRKTLAERELAEEALRESEERYRELVENANDIVYTLDFEGRITSINKAAETITEYSQDELLRMRMGDILTAESVSAGQQMLNNKMSGQQRTNYEVEITAKKGRILTLEISSRLIYKGDEPVGFQGIARDISARRRAEEALREADQRALSEYERLLERISGLAQALGTARDLTTIFRGLRDFTRTSVNCDGFFVSLYDPIRDVRTACYGWGDGKEVDISELPPMPVTTLGPNSRAVRTGQVIITDDYMDATRGHPVVIVGPDDGLRPQSSLAVPMAVMGRIIGTIEVQSYEGGAYRQEHATAMGMAANLTAVAIENVRLLERESRAREAAEESNRLKDEFLATVSHELRTPLTAILGWSRLLEAGSLDDRMATHAIETIWRNAKAQAQIVDDILDVSRIITGNLYLDLQPIELVPIVEAAINVVRPTADAKAIKIETDFDTVPTVVSGDANRLQQVIWNLVSNAVKFTESGGIVRLSLRQIGSSVEIEVTDTGQGISPEFLPFVFDRFRQADSTTTRQHGGLGLGLAIARHLIEIHGGAIRAESLGEGQGATFTIKLPLLDLVGKGNQLNRNEAGERPLSLAQQLSGVRVLLVDDDEDNLELMTTALTGRKASVTAVSSALEAIRAIQANRPDVLISDIAMPDEDGYALIQKVRALDYEGAQTIPAVAITAYAKEEDRQHALSAGFHIYLAKPVELSELISVVARAARREF
jgi:PAS domain S-box-containing protein